MPLYKFFSLLNVLGQIANEMGLEKRIINGCTAHCLALAAFSVS
jgi:hypothetical protein